MYLILFEIAGKNQHSIALYDETERKITLYTKRCIAVVTTVATGCFLVPIGNALFQFASGTYTRDAWFYPLKVV